MNEAERNPRWYHHPWREESAPAVQDPADLGTAFGLDLSLQRALEDAPPAAATGVSPPPKPRIRKG